MAHKKAGGSTANGRDSNPKMRGVKRYGGEFVTPGNVIVRQKGTKFHLGTGVAMGSDFTIFAMVEGNVKFSHFTKTRQIVSVIPA